MKGRSLYLECETGISGDMIVAALLDLGADEEVLRKTLSGIEDEGFEIKIKRVLKSGIDCCDFEVILDEEHENHDHDMDYLYGHERHPHADHDHDRHAHTDHEHEHHEHTDHEHHHHHHGRNLQDINVIIDSLDMTDRARSLAVRVFDILAQAEAKAHNRPKEEVHFHEVGAIDSIVDIVSAAVCFDDLDIDEVVIKRICEGSGSVRCQHGIIPVPVPAVVNIVQSHSLPICITDRRGELITPTGAAFAAAVMTGDRLPGTMKVIKTGMGAGKRTYDRPSILRAVLFEKGQENDRIIKLESNIDDCAGEHLGYVMGKLFEAGARDVYYTPVYMKKNRPGWLLTVITDRDKVDEMEYMIFRETTTIGIRRQEIDRTLMSRESVRVMTDAGEGMVKVCRFRDLEKVYPEYESALELAQKTGRSLDEIYKKLIDSYSCV